MTKDKKINLVSVHGGHSKNFCSHAQSPLEDMIKEYINQGFLWVGITEHIPPLSDRFIYEEERIAGFDVKSLHERFALYIKEAFFLKEKYKDKLKILVGFETESYEGYEAYVKNLLKEFKPDYVLGSVHHVDNVEIDYNYERYQEAVEKAGSIENLYLRYFDIQYEMIQKTKPDVLAHFDLIRMFDPDYKRRMEEKTIKDRIMRNLSLIKKLSITLDFNTRALVKGFDEPYLTLDILKEAVKLGIKIMPGDDSHSTEDVGFGIEKAIRILDSIGADTKWTDISFISTLSSRLNMH